jgi:hypothetical protein
VTNPLFLLTTEPQDWSPWSVRHITKHEEKNNGDPSQNQAGPPAMVIFRVYRCYFLLLFFWLAAIFSFDVISAGFAWVGFPAGAEPDFASVISGFLLFPAGVP